MTGPYIFKKFEASEDGGWWDCPPGHWCASFGSKGTPQLNVFLACPACKLLAGLPHKVDAAGRVSPSVVCPHAPCPMHLSPVTLADWTHGERGSER